MEAIRLNLKSLGIVSSYGLEPRTVSSFLRRVAQQERKIYIVFLDPPYMRSKNTRPRWTCWIASACRY